MEYYVGLDVSLSQRNRRLADMLGKGEDFLQGDLGSFAGECEILR